MKTSRFISAGRISPPAVYDLQVTLLQSDPNSSTRSPIWALSRNRIEFPTSSFRFMTFTLGGKGRGNVLRFETLLGSLLLRSGIQAASSDSTPIRTPCL